MSTTASEAQPCQPGLEHQMGRQPARMLPYVIGQVIHPNGGTPVGG